MAADGSHRPLILKVGGSLLDWPELKGRLKTLLKTVDGRSGLLIVGGGDAADVVRRWDVQHSLLIEASHRLAIHSMSLTARFVADLLEIPLVDSIAIQAGISVLDSAREVLTSTASEPLPASWDVTSDSIALWIATQVPKSELILVKSTDWPVSSTIQFAAEAGLIDPYFPCLVGQLAQVPRLGWINLRSEDLTCRWIS